MRERFIGINTIYGAHGEHETPYLTRIWIGRLRLHIFHRGDADPDCHDHPWDFWTFPLTSYVEEIALPDPFNGGFDLYRQVVRAFRRHFRPAEHTHRVIGRWNGCFHRPWPGTYDELPVVFSYEDDKPRRATDKPSVGSGRIVTIVWQGRPRRKWGFLRNRDGSWCWTPWKDYVFGGGKHAPCEPGDRL